MKEGHDERSSQSDRNISRCYSVFSVGRLANIAGFFTVGSTAVVGRLVAEQAQDLALQRREIGHEDHWIFAADARSVL